MCWFRVDITYNHLNEINTKKNDLNIKIRNKNYIYFKCTSTIYFLILNFDLILFSFYLLLNLIILSKYFLLSRASHRHNTSIVIAGIRAQNHILNLGLCPRTLTSSRMDK